MKNTMRNLFEAKGMLIGIFMSMLILSGCHNLHGKNSEMIRSAYADNYEITEQQEIKSSERFIRQFLRQRIGVIEKQKESTHRCREKKEQR